MAFCYEYSSELLISKNSVRILLPYTPDCIEDGDDGDGGSGDGCSDCLVSSNIHLLYLP